MEFRAHTTVDEVYRPAMVITDPARAAEYFERIVRHHMAVAGVPREEAERVERHNLYYFAGFYDAETRARVERLFDVSSDSLIHF